MQMNERCRSLRFDVERASVSEPQMSPHSAHRAESVVVGVLGPAQTNDALCVRNTNGTYLPLLIVALLDVGDAVQIDRVSNAAIVSSVTRSKSFLRATSLWTMASTASLTIVIIAWTSSFVVLCDKDFTSPITLGIGGIFPFSDTTSQTIQYSVSKYVALFNSVTDSRLLSKQQIADIVSFEGSLDIVVTSDTLAQTTTPYISYHLALNNFSLTIGDDNALSVATAKLFGHLRVGTRRRDARPH